MAVKIQLRRDTASNWTTNNPVLAAGEQGHESDTDRRKIGNGIDDWNTLPYLFEQGDSQTATNTSAIAALILEQSAQDSAITDNLNNTVTNADDILDLETDLEDHETDTNNPHAVTFTQAVQADPATDITAVEAEELTDDSVTELHKHSNLYVPNGSVAALETNAASGIILPAYPATRNDGVSQQALTTSDTTGLTERRTILPFYAYSKKTAAEFNQTTTEATYDTLIALLPEDGDYLIRCWFIWSMNSGATDINVALNLDGTDLFKVKMEPQDTAGNAVAATNVNTGAAGTTGTDQTYPDILEDIQTLTAGNHTIEIQWDASTTNDIPTIHRSILSIERKA